MPPAAPSRHGPRLDLVAHRRPPPDGPATSPCHPRAVRPQSPCRSCGGAAPRESCRLGLRSAGIERVQLVPATASVPVTPPVSYLAQDRGISWSVVAALCLVSCPGQYHLSPGHHPPHGHPAPGQIPRQLTMSMEHCRGQGHVDGTSPWFRPGRPRPRAPAGSTTSTTSITSTGGAAG